MTTEQQKDEAITMLRGALQKVLAAHLAQANDIRLILDLTDPARRTALRAANRNAEALRRNGIG